MSALRRVVVLLFILGSVTLLASTAGTARTRAAADLVEVVVTLPQPSLADARLDRRTAAGRRYTRRLERAQDAALVRIRDAVPAARLQWRYTVTLNGMAVAVPRVDAAKIKSTRGVTVWPSATYGPLLDRTPQLIGAPAVWGPTLATAGQGMKIAIIDDGLDQTHPFFNPAGYSYPPGYPKGNTAYTTPKVIVARAFAPASNTWKYARAPFDPVNSEHATNVAGIAAGNRDTVATVNGNRVRVSGVAPAAYLGNYKVLTVPTTDFGLDGNAPEIAAAIEQAVKDGMDVLNLSLGEPEIEPSRDIVLKAIEAAADAGVVTVVAAGNGFGDAGRGGIGSPANAPDAITVAASGDDADVSANDVIAGFSDSGPTPISLQFKPDVTAPGQNLLSSLPGGAWSNYDWSGTSMAAPHVAGAVAVLKQRHPTWTPQQLKSALATTGDPVRPGGGAGEVSALREGGGRIDLSRADSPLIFVEPTNISFGLVKRGESRTQTLTVTDAGGGTAGWTPSLAAQTSVKGATITVSPAATVALTVAADASEGDGVGFVTLTRGADVRRIAYWFRVEVPRLGTQPHRTLAKPGVYGGNTKGRRSVVSTYRYPELGLACNCKTGVPLNLSGPEQVFRFTLTKPVANFGAAILTRAPGVRIQPRLVVAGDENRLVGFTALPVGINPYRDYGRVVPAVGAILPRPAAYDFVFDTPAGAKPGAFTFRFWIDDTTPPRVRVLAATRGAIRLGVTDAGAGVDPGSIELSVDGVQRPYTLRRGVLTVRGVRAGARRVALTVADFQESKNMEDIGSVLPNTRTFRTRVNVG